MPHFCGKSHATRLWRHGNGDKPETPGDCPGERREAEIARLAHSYWEARGCRDGSAEEDWYRAEREWERSRDRG